MTLEDAIADARQDAAVLRRYGNTAQAECIDRLLARIEASASEYLTWVSEEKAHQWTGHAPQWFRARFHDWQARGLAKIGGNNRRAYRAVVIERDERLVAARERGMRAAMGERIPRNKLR